MIPLITQSIFDLIILVIMLFASKADLKTRTVPPKYQIALGITSLLHLIVMPILEKDFGCFLNYFLTGLFVFAIHIGIFLIFKGGIGGADTKVTSIMSMFLGWKQTICFIVSHSLVAVILSMITFKREGIKVKSVPLMPFLTIGFLITKAIFWAGQIGLIGFQI